MQGHWRESAGGTHAGCATQRGYGARGQACAAQQWPEGLPTEKGTAETRPAWTPAPSFLLQLLSSVPPPPPRSHAQQAAGLEVWPSPQLFAQCKAWVMEDLRMELGEGTACITNTVPRPRAVPTCHRSFLQQMSGDTKFRVLCSGPEDVVNKTGVVLASWSLKLSEGAGQTPQIHMSSRGTGSL